VWIDFFVCDFVYFVYNTLAYTGSYRQAFMGSCERNYSVIFRVGESYTLKCGVDVGERLLREMHTELEIVLRRSPALQELGIRSSRHCARQRDARVKFTRSS
jgi:hypothetical protein